MQQKRQLAQRLLAAARAKEKDAAVQFVLANMAREEAASAAQLKLALGASVLAILLSRRPSVISPASKSMRMAAVSAAGASKLHNGKPVGLAHGLLYVEIVDRPGTKRDRLTVRSYVTRDNWETAQWDRIWQKSIESPDRATADSASAP